MNDIPSARLAVWFIAIAIALAALNVTAALFAPIVLALVLGVVLSPFAGRIDRLGAPPALAAFLTLLAALSAILGVMTLLQPVVAEAVERAPIIWAELRGTITSIQASLRGLENVSAEVSQAINDGEADAGTTVANAARPEAEEDAVRMPTVADALLYAPGYAARIMIFVGTLYFFLLSRREVYDWISASDMTVTTEHMLEAEREVSRYFLTITLINGTFGVLLAGVLWLLGMPYPILWGFTGFLANYILYLGPAIFASALLLGGIVAFDGAFSVVPAACYVGMNLIEGQFVTPSLVGRTMAVSPLLVFLSLVFWLWMWGPVGGIIAIPLLVWGLALHKRHKTVGSNRAQGGQPPPGAVTRAAGT